MKIIVNADDLGSFDNVDRRIFEGIEQGYITSATIMANGENLHETIKHTKYYNNISFGVHLNLTSGQPLTSSDQLRGLLDEEGCLCRGKLCKITSACCTKAIYKELSAQVELLQKQGLPISHIDFHHHAHNLPWVFHVAKAIQYKYKISKMRLTQNLFCEPRSPFLLIKKHFFNFALKNIVPTITTDYFSDLASFVKTEDFAVYEDKTIELMVHPGAKSFQAETDICYSDWWEDLNIEPEFISYNDL